MPANRDTYARKALAAIPRLLTLLDRNPYSPTYGCFHRDYWLYKTSDFPDVVRQFGVHALALVYKHDFPDNPYKGAPQVRDWTLAALDFWARQQHGDGSFDEFYPYERGWVGPTAFTTFTSVEALQLLGREVPAPLRERVTEAARRAARLIAAGEAEKDELANHHAMACLAVWKVSELTGEAEFEAGFKRRWQEFLTYHNPREGWSREYDGTDPGYLSATVSFLAKIYKTNPDPDILRVLTQSTEFCSYFVYPNGAYAGSTGSRNTQHFYCDGFEILAGHLPIAAAVAERTLQGLEDGALVPPEIMSDRYVFYRVPELLEAYLDSTPRPARLAPLPYERDGLTRYFPEAGIYAATRGPHYCLANLAKGGVIKVFDRDALRLVYNDAGFIGRLRGGHTVTSQWISPEHRHKADDDGFEISGQFQLVASQKVFSLLKSLMFRSLLLLMGWHAGFCHHLKGRIRAALILGQRPAPLAFARCFRLSPDGDFSLTDEVRLTGAARVESLSVGGEFFVRYVPQSRFFQAQELTIESQPLTDDKLRELNDDRVLTLEVSERPQLQDRAIT